nr:DNA damage-inducible protein 1-like [Ipomoea batatas]
MLQTQSDHELAQIFLGNDLNKLQEILSLRHKHRAELLCRRDEEMALLYADPFDVEAQKKIEEAIRQKNPSFSESHINPMASPTCKFLLFTNSIVQLLVSRKLPVFHCFSLRSCSELVSKSHTFTLNPPVLSQAARFSSSINARMCFLTYSLPNNSLAESFTSLTLSRFFIQW